MIPGVSGPTPQAPIPEQPTKPGTKTSKKISLKPPDKETIAKLARDLRAQHIKDAEATKQEGVTPETPISKIEKRQELLSQVISGTKIVEKMKPEEILKTIRFNKKFKEINGQLYSVKYNKPIGLTKDQLIQLTRVALRKVKTVPNNETVDIAANVNTRFKAALVKSSDNTLTLKIFGIREAVVGQGSVGHVRLGEKISGKPVAEKTGIYAARKKISTERQNLVEIHKRIEQNREALIKDYPEAFIAKTKKGKETSKCVVLQPAPMAHSSVKDSITSQKYNRDLMKEIHRSLKTHKTPPLETMLPMALDYAMGMAILHKVGVIHCDNKAENAFVDENNRVALADFDGIVLLKDPKTDPDLTIEEKEVPLPTQSGKTTNAATILELDRAIQKNSREAFNQELETHDCFSLGITLFEMFTGKEINNLQGKSFKVHDVVAGETLYTGILRNKQTFELPEFKALPDPLKSLIKGLILGTPDGTADEAVKELRKLNASLSTSI